MESTGSLSRRFDYHKDMLLQIERALVPDIATRLDDIEKKLSSKEKEIFEKHYKELFFSARLEAVGEACKDMKEFKGLGPETRAKIILRMGAVRLLSAKWLLDQPQDFIIARLQDLPSKALLSSAYSAKLLEETGGVIVISYGWLSNKHPDPRGWHMRTVRRYLEKHIRWNFQPHQNRPKTEEELSLGATCDNGVFWDFPSLPQANGNIPRTKEEKMLFTIGLEVVNLLYGAHRTIVIQLKTVPDSLVLSEGMIPNLTPYEKRGWCFFEEVVSGIIKDGDRLLDLCHAEDKLDDPAATFREVRYHAVQHRQPPHDPEAMAVKLRTLNFTDGRTDMDRVIGMYNTFFDEASASVKERLFLANKGSGVGWSDEDIATLADALPHYWECSTLDLDGHFQMTEAGLNYLTPVMLNAPLMRKVLLPSHLKDTAAGRAFKEDWASAGKPPQNLIWSTQGKDVGPVLA